MIEPLARLRHGREALPYTVLAIPLRLAQARPPDARRASR